MYEEFSIDVRNYDYGGLPNIFQDTELLKILNDDAILDEKQMEEMLNVVL